MILRSDTRQRAGEEHSNTLMPDRSVHQQLYVFDNYPIIFDGHYTSLNYISVLLKSLNKKEATFILLFYFSVFWLLSYKFCGLF